MLTLTTAQGRSYMVHIMPCEGSKDTGPLPDDVLLSLLSHAPDTAFISQPHKTDHTPT